MPSLYSSLFSSSFYAAEKPTISYLAVTERHIQALWLEQKYFNALSTHQGESIEIISPGIWNTEAGPDFLKAHIKIGSHELRGDIEIHLREEDWFTHGHQRDKRYDNVILHIALWSSFKPKDIIKSNGLTAASACLEPVLTVPIDQLEYLIDTDLYPYRQFIEVGHCARALFNDLSNDKIKILFKSAAYWRLEQKKEALQVRFSSLPLQLIGGIARALGYKANAEAFGDLFSFLWAQRHRPANDLLSLGLGCCGFFDKKLSDYWIHSDYFQLLKGIWESQKSAISFSVALKLDHIRPFNHPIRRMAYLVKLLQDPQIENLWPRIYSAWENIVSSGKSDDKTLRALRQTFLDLVPSYQDAYWNHHYTFESYSRLEFLSLMGDELRVEIIVNVFLPLLYAEIKMSGDMQAYQFFDRFYNHFKRMRTSKVLYLTQRFFGETGKENLLSNSQMEQGAYQLHKDFCVHFEASCKGCPFVDRYNESAFGTMSTT